MYLYLLYFYAVASAITFMAYAIDKRRAKKKRSRISEAFLLCTGFFGGSVGALLGMNFFRHKTRHWYFWTVNVVGLLCQVVLLFWVWQMKI